MTWPDGFQASYAYDAVNRVTDICQQLASCTAAQHMIGIAYDDLGRRDLLTRVHSGTVSTTTSYDYDLLGQMTLLKHLGFSNGGYTGTWNNFSYNVAGQVLAFDLNNNNYVRTPTNVAVTASYDGLNRDAAVAALGSGFDGRQNQTRSTDGARTFAYDQENRLVSATSSSGGMTLTYDPLGRLLTTTPQTGPKITYLYEGDRLIAEYNFNGSSLLRRYVHGPGVDEPLVWYEGTGTASRTWLYADRQGSIVATANDTGAGVDRYAYGPYGDPDSWTGSRFRYTGQIMLPDARLYHYKARAYDPQSGRFLQTDPVGYEADFGLYSYVGEDPINLGDSSGLCPDACVLEATAGVGLGAVYATAAAGVALGLCVQTCGEIVHGINHFAAKAWNGFQARLHSNETVPLTRGLARSIGVSRSQNSLHVYRLYGGGSGPNGASWTPQDPRTMINPRQELGLPAVNTASMLAEGDIRDFTGVGVKLASPIGENKGGAVELIVPNAAAKVINRVDRPYVHSGPAGMGAGASTNTSNTPKPMSGCPSAPISGFSCGPY